MRRGWQVRHLLHGLGAGRAEFFEMAVAAWKDVRTHEGLQPSAEDEQSV